MPDPRHYSQAITSSRALHGHAVVQVREQKAAPMSGDPEPWKERGLCREKDPDENFPEKGESAKEAKDRCNGTQPGTSPCPVRRECLNDALRRDERYGVWGGMSERERQRLKRISKIGAPVPRGQMIDSRSEFVRLHPQRVA